MLGHNIITATRGAGGSFGPVLHWRTRRRGCRPSSRRERLHLKTLDFLRLIFDAQFASAAGFSDLRALCYLCDQVSEPPPGPVVGNPGQEMPEL